MEVVMNKVKTDIDAITEEVEGLFSNKVLYGLAYRKLKSAIRKYIEEDRFISDGSYIFFGKKYINNKKSSGFTLINVSNASDNSARIALIGDSIEYMINVRIHKGKSLVSFSRI